MSFPVTNLVRAGIREISDGCPGTQGCSCRGCRLLQALQMLYSEGRRQLQATLVAHVGADSPGSHTTGGQVKHLGRRLPSRSQKVQQYADHSHCGPELQHPLHTFGNANFVSQRLPSMECSVSMACCALAASWKVTKPKPAGNRQGRGGMLSAHLTAAMIRRSLTVVHGPRGNHLIHEEPWSTAHSHAGSAFDD